MQLHTDRLVLSEFQPSDAERLAAYQSDARDLVEMFCLWAEQSPRTKYQLAITVQDRVIGTCGIRKDADQDDHAEFGCELDPAFWNAGFAREAGKAMLNFGFTVLGLRRIRARTLATNDRAIALALSLGFRRVSDDLFELSS